MLQPLVSSSERMLYCSCSLAASCCLQLCWILHERRNMVRDESCQWLVDGPGLTASVTSPGR